MLTIVILITIIIMILIITLNIENLEEELTKIGVNIKEISRLQFFALLASARILRSV